MKKRNPINGQFINEYDYEQLIDKLNWEKNSEKIKCIHCGKVSRVEIGNNFCPCCDNVYHNEQIGIS